MDTNRQLYDGLLQRYKEIGVAGGVGINNISVVDKAYAPDSPYKPRLSVNLAIALMFGLLAGVAGALVREQLGDTFQSPEDLEASLGVPMLGIIPLIRDPAERAKALVDPRSELSEAYRALCTTLQFSTATGLPKTLLVTSPRASEGKSTTAMVTARNLAQLGMKVLLVDADLRRPSVHKHLKLPNDAGLSNLLTGSAVPPDLFRSTETRGLSVLTCGPLPPNPVELLSGHRMLSLLTVAAEVRRGHRRRPARRRPRRRSAAVEHDCRHAARGRCLLDASPRGFGGAEAVVLRSRPDRRRRREQGRHGAAELRLCLRLLLRRAQRWPRAETQEAIPASTAFAGLLARLKGE